MTQSTDELERLMREATPGPWHHVQAFESVPAVRTIHGKVPGQRVDYVSTWPGPGTPKGHRVVIPMETVTEEGIVRTATSADMALICAAVNALPELVERVRRYESLIRALIENEPDDIVADGGHTVLDEWRYNARSALTQEPGHE